MIIGINPQTQKQYDTILAANYASDNEITLLIDSLPSITQQEYDKLVQLALGNVEEFHPHLLRGMREFYEVKLRDKSLTVFVYSLNYFASTDAMKRWIWSYNVRTMYPFIRKQPYTEAEWNIYIDDLEAEGDVYWVRNEILRKFVRNEKIDYGKMKQVILNDWSSFIGNWDMLVKFSINNRIYIVVR